MPRGPAPQFRQKAEHTVEMMPYVAASVNQAPMNETTGHYAELIYTGIKTSDRALQVKRGLYNAAKHHGVSMKADTESLTDGTYQVRFRAIDKKRARAYLIATKGKDRSQWAYDPRRKGK